MHTGVTGWDLTSTCKTTLWTPVWQDKVWHQHLKSERKGFPVRTIHLLQTQWKHEECIVQSFLKVIFRKIIKYKKKEIYREKSVFRMTCGERSYQNTLYIVRCHTIYVARRTLHWTYFLSKYLEKFTKISLRPYTDLTFPCKCNFCLYDIKLKWNVFHIHTAFLKNMLQIMI